MRIGVMQGRLSPPENGKFQSFPSAWREEFPRAVEAGVEYIEWIVDSVDNPIFTVEGREEMLGMKLRWGVDIPAICCDWMMEHPLRASYGEWKKMLVRLSVLAHEVGVKRIVIPFVDNSSIDDPGIVLDALRFTYDEVELHLETDLPPRAVRELLEHLPQHIRATWDSGNSSGLGYRASEEFQAYGERIGSIHIKDRLRTKETKPLGEGGADFADVFASIRSVGYDGDLTLQVARGVDGDEVAWIRKQAEFVRRGLWPNA